MLYLSHIVLNTDGTTGCLLCCRWSTMQVIMAGGNAMWKETCKTLASTSCPTYGMRSCSIPQTLNLNRSYYINQWVYLYLLSTPQGQWGHRGSNNDYHVCVVYRQVGDRLTSSFQLVPPTGTTCVSHILTCLLPHGFTTQHVIAWHSICHTPDN